MAGMGTPVYGRAKSLLGPQGLSESSRACLGTPRYLVSEAEASANIAHPASRGGASRSRLPCGPPITGARRAECEELSPPQPMGRREFWCVGLGLERHRRGPPGAQVQGEECWRGSCHGCTICHSRHRPGHHAREGGPGGGRTRRPFRVRGTWRAVPRAAQAETAAQSAAAGPQVRQLPGAAPPPGASGHPLLLNEVS